MLGGGASQKVNEFKKLGIYCLYCVAINLKSDNKQCNIDLFADDTILQKFFGYLTEPRNNRQHGHQKLVSEEYQEDQ